MTDSTAKPAKRIMLAILASRILGLVREVVLNAIFGAGKELDAFIAAFRFPNLLRDLFAEGALSLSFVSVFSKKLEKDGKPAAFRLANIVLSVACVILGLVTVLGIFASPLLVKLITPGFYDIPGKAELTIQLTRILFPFIFFVSLAAVYMGLLNSLGSFGLPASASAAFNLVSILSGLLFGYLIDPQLGVSAIYGFAAGTVLGGIVQLIIQIPRGIQLGHRPKWLFDWRDEGLKRVFLLTLPAVAGSAAVQVNVLVNTWFASFLENGAVTWLNNAFRLMQLPIGMFGVAIAMVTLPSISRSVAQENQETFRSKITDGLHLGLFLTIPASIGLAILAEPIISVIYERGAFSAYDTTQTAWALRAYAVGLASYACIKILIPAFYALDMPKIPVRVSIIGIGLNILLNYLFIRVWDWGVAGLAMATSLVALLNLAQLLWALRVHLLRWKPTLAFLKKLGVATLVMSAGVWFLTGFFASNAHDFWGKLLLLLAVIPVGSAVFGCAAFWLKMDEIHALLPFFKKLASKER